MKRRRLQEGKISLEEGGKSLPLGISTGVFFLFLFLSLRPGYFSPRRGYHMILKISWAHICNKNCDTVAVTGEVCLHLIYPLTPPQLYLNNPLVFSIWLFHLCLLHVVFFICAMCMPRMISKHVHMFPFPAVISYFYILFFVICLVSFEVISCQQVFR